MKFLIFLAALTVGIAQVATCDTAKSDLVFMLDASGSVTEHFLLMKYFVKDFLSEANIDDGNVRVGLLVYSTDVHVEFDLNTNSTKLDLFNAIEELPYRSGVTNTADAIEIMHSRMFNRSNGDRPDVDNICVILTDGESNINSRRTIPEAEAARAKGIHIYAISIGLKESKELDGIASKPVQNNRFTLQQFSELEGLKHKVFEPFCESTATPRPSTPEPKTTVSLHTKNDCSMNSTGYLPFDRFCYKFDPQEMSWLEAQGECNKSSGYLAEPKTSIENTFILSLVATKLNSVYQEVWLGGNDRKEENYWVWGSDNSPLLGFSDWKPPHEPKNSNNNEDCLMSGLGRWEAENCEDKRPFICQKPR